jgi:hypothetical protein
MKSNVIEKLFGTLFELKFIAVKPLPTQKSKA